jgi:ParB family chromosome partitioning protein
MTQGAAGAKKPVRSALGRGLSALVSTTATPVPVETTTTRDLTPTAALTPSVPSNADAALSVKQTGNYPQPAQAVDFQAKDLNLLPISQMRANPKQPRQDFSDQEIAELADSIKTLGVLQPILVRPLAGAPSSTYQIVAGERRFRAAIRAGLSQVPVVIRELDDREALEIALVENVQRQGLNPIEEALGYQKLIDEFSLTAQEVAERVGKDRATVSNTTRLLKLPQLIQEMLRDGRISVGHAKAILTVREPAAQIGLANKIITESLSVRAIESIVARDVVLESPKKDRILAARRSRVAEYPEIEERLRNVLGTKVTIHKKRKGGSIEVHFFSDEELDRLVHFVGASRE